MSIVQCTVCGRVLKSPIAQEMGMGRVCAEKSGKGFISIRSEALLPFDGKYLVFKRSPNGTPMTNVPHKFKHHSPDGFEWGYSGSGPADLALNILLFMGWRRDKALECHQDFKELFIAPMKKEGGMMIVAKIKTWMAGRTAKRMSA